MGTGLILIERVPENEVKKPIVRSSLSESSLFWNLVWVSLNKLQ